MAADVSNFIAKRISDQKVGNFSSLISRIAVGSIALGIATLLLSFTIFEGFRATIQDKIFALSGHILIEKFSLNQSMEESPIDLNDSELYLAKDTISEIEHLQVFAHKWSILKHEEEVTGILLKGVSQDFDSIRLQGSLVEGRFPNLASDKYSKEIVVSRRIADKMGLSLGDKVILFFIQQPPKARPLHIVGIYETGIEDFDDRVAIGDIRLVQRINGWNDNIVGGMEIFVSDFDLLDQDYEAISEVTDLDLIPIKISEEFSHFFDWFTMLNKNVIVFMSIILVVVLFNIISITLILIMERTNMIGSLKAIGANNWQIRKIFMYNGSRILLKGLLLGNVLGFTLALLQKYGKIIPLDPETYYMSYVPITFKWSIVIGVNALVAILVIAIQLIPTSIISRLSPIKVIKFS
ncbi:ABC transporter permease [Sediminitomix flava]|uniref:Lipoprotein-releasing system permease protein n=1 Tax=Sediminitomix flava TaxID=379075 RepID=A0A315ZHN6_SEDFL|nr:FtsX-like permease family protein [Sediminitomix flava]PWJ44318.1 lipoprotein-releasing system permease protein [Sediminitomix flava]